MAKFSPISVMISNDTVAASSVCATAARMTVDVLKFNAIKIVFIFLESLMTWLDISQKIIGVKTAQLVNEHC